MVCYHHLSELSFFSQRDGASDAVDDEGAKAFKAKQQHGPSLIQQIQKEALKVQNDALKGIGSLKNKVHF